MANTAVAAEAASDDKMITLKSHDEKTFQLPKSAAKLSGFISDTLNFEDEGEEPEEYEQVEVKRVNGDCLQKVVDFLVHYQQDPLPEIRQPLIGHSLNEVVTNKFYQDYVSEESMDKSMLFRVLSAANYMSIKPLLDLACLWCTFQISGKSPEEIRILLNLPTMTPEEEARAREEHPWVFDNDA